VADELNLNVYLALADSLECWDCDYGDMKYGRYHEYNEKITTPYEPTLDYIACSEVILKHWIDKDNNILDLPDFALDESVIWGAFQFCG
jgi:hypothetical protein